MPLTQSQSSRKKFVTQTQSATTIKEAAQKIQQQMLNAMRDIKQVKIKDKVKIRLLLLLKVSSLNQMENR